MWITSWLLSFTRVAVCEFSPLQPRLGQGGGVNKGAHCDPALPPWHPESCAHVLGRVSCSLYLFFELFSWTESYFKQQLIFVSWTAQGFFLPSWFLQRVLPPSLLLFLFYSCIWLFCFCFCFFTLGIASGILFDYFSFFLLLLLLLFFSVLAL